MDHHGLKYIIRSHEPVEQGTERLDCGDGRAVVTVFSTAAYPNGEGTNLGAVVELDKEGSCLPIEFSYNHRGADTSRSEGSNAYVVALRSFIMEKRSKLDREFKSIENGGLITISQWADIMTKSLDLADIPWFSLQPSLAPTTDQQSDLLDWRHFLTSYLQTYMVLWMKAK
jgi:hypothetical protein